MSRLIIKKIDFTSLDLKQVNERLKEPHTLSFGDLSYIGNRIDRLFKIDTEWHKIKNPDTGSMCFQLLEVTRKD